MWAPTHLSVSPTRTQRYGTFRLLETKNQWGFKFEFYEIKSYETVVSFLHNLPPFSVFIFRFEHRESYMIYYKLIDLH